MADAMSEKYALQARFFKALAHPLRLAVLRTLRSGEKCVSEIVQKVSCSQSNISRHLSAMEWAGILERRKKGLRVYYRLRSSLPCIEKFLKCAIEAQGCAPKEK